MPSTQGDLCECILEDHFGYYVAIVGRFLLSNRLPFALIIRNIVPKLTSLEVKRSLAILDHHNLLEFEYSSRGVLYSVPMLNTIRLLRIPRSIFLIRTLYGQVAEVLFSEVSSRGKLCCSEAIRRACKKLGLTDHKEAKTQFSRLAQTKMIIRCASVKGDDCGFPVFEDCRDPFLIPNKILDGDSVVSSSQVVAEDSRKRKLEEEKLDSDVGILWKVNWPCMETFLREELIVDAISGNEVFDSMTLVVAKQLIKTGESKQDFKSRQSNPISLQDVFYYARQNNLTCDRNMIDEKLTLLGLESNTLIRRVADSGGGLYVINYEKAIEYLCNEHIESAISEKLGENGVRIFRLLYSKGHLEEEQIEKQAMLSSKETKQLCYVLLDNNFITTRPVAKRFDFDAAQTIFLYNVAFSQLVGSMIALTISAINNCIRRRMFEAKKAEALTDKNDKMEMIIDGIKNSDMDEESKKEQISEVEDYMTDGDLAELEKFKKSQNALWSTEIELEKVLFVFQQAQLYKQMATTEEPVAKKKGRTSKKTPIQGSDGSSFPLVNFTQY